MAEFTFRSVVQRKLSYNEVDDNFRRVQELHDETLAARDVAVSDTIIYPDTTAGLAATAEGGYFVVPDTATDELIYYRVESGAAVEKVRIGFRLPFPGGTLTTALNHAPAVSLASAATVNIGAAAANAITITGTTTITAFDSIADGAIRVLTFSGALTLTHNATSLILPGGADITTAAGDVAVMLSLGSGNWRCVAYQRASGKALAETQEVQIYESPEQTITTGGSGTLTHGLGAAPRITQAWLRCTTADIGYSIGDETPAPTGVVAIIPGSSAVAYKFSSGNISILRKDTGASTGITLSSWRLVIRAMK